MMIKRLDPEHLPSHYHSSGTKPKGKAKTTPPVSLLDKILDAVNSRGDLSKGEKEKLCAIVKEIYPTL